ncbi:hypothetical protein [Halogranum rubrum]|uniref:Uncharacterized protein n=1 Tax=Halogranum salarium B-1 TaxID=1210908 RepID=J3EV89_9EURY|nr:hypothetical protein [Halogranum salarium]EJN58492.1 hypothetical protein HSB1_29700 [Halogranum salarium B-1]
MSNDINRRNTLKLLGAAAGTLSLSGIAASNTPAETRAVETTDTPAQLEGGAIEWRRTYDAGESEVANDVVVLDDGYAFVGSTTPDAPVSDYYLVETDEAGEVRWSRTFGGDGDQDGYGLLSVDDGYVVCGRSRTEAGDAGTVVALDDEGTERWQTEVGTKVNDVARTEDGGYVVAGTKGTTAGGSPTSLLGKLTADGSVEWTKSYGADGGEFAAVEQTPDGGYALAGQVFSNGYWTMKTDSEGVEEWSASGREGRAKDVAVTADGDVLSTGNVVGSGGFSPYLARFAPDGTVRFKTQYDAIDASSANGVTELSNGGIVLSTDGFGLLVVDSEGTKQWFEDYDGEANALARGADDSVVVAGTTGGDESDAVLAKSRSLVDDTEGGDSDGSDGDGGVDVDEDEC